MDYQDDYSSTPTFQHRHRTSTALADKGTLTYAIREYVIPSAVFIAMIYWLWKNIILPIIRDPQMIPSYSGWSGRGGQMADLDVVDDEQQQQQGDAAKEGDAEATTAAIEGETAKNK